MPSRVPRPLRRPPNRHTTGLQRRGSRTRSSTPAAGFVHSFWHTSPDFLKHLNILKPEDKLFFRVFSVYDGFTVGSGGAGAGGRVSRGAAGKRDRVCLHRISSRHCRPPPGMRRDRGDWPELESDREKTSALGGSCAGAARAAPGVCFSRAQSTQAQPRHCLSAKAVRKAQAWP